MSGEVNQQQRGIRRRAVRDFFRRSQQAPQNSPLVSQIPLPASIQLRPTSATATTPPSQVSHQPVPSQSFSERAISSLPLGDQAIVRRHLAESADNASNAIEEAFKAAVVQKQVCEDEKLRIKFRGRYIVLRDEADKVVEWIKQFLPVGDIVANVDPIHVGLPWAGIRVILQLVIASSTQRAALLAGMNLAMHMTSRLQAYLTNQAHRHNSPASATFENALVKLYAIVLRFFDSAVNACGTGLARNLLWPGSALTKFEDTCLAWASQVEIDANNAHQELSQQERDEMKEWVKIRLAPALHRIDDQVSDVLNNQQREKYQKIVTWLSPPDPNYNHDAACRRHEPETGNWLVQSPEYQEWNTSHNTSLWLAGGAGYGKTVLCSTVIEDIRFQCSDQSMPGVQLAYFYFSFSDTQKQSYTGMLSSLIVQLSQGQATFDKLQEVYDKRISESRPSIRTLEETLLSCLRRLGQTVLVLDALDELPERNDDGRPAVMKWIGEVMHSNDHKLKIFVTSRQLADIEGSLRSLGARHVVLRPDLANNDIQTFVAVALEKHWKLRDIDDESKEKIKKEFQRKSGGMFRWAALQLEELKQLKITGPKFVDELLRSLPQSLDEMYARMLSQIAERYRDTAVNALRWLTFSSRPLTVRELAEACLIDCAHGYSVDVRSRGRPKEILEVLGSLIVVEAKEDNNVCEDDSHQQQEDSSEADIQPVCPESRVRLAHFSVKEYFISDRILDHGGLVKFAFREDRDTQVLAQSCLAYLLYYSNSPSKALSKTDLDAFPLLQYAAEMWTTFMPKSELLETGFELQLLDSDEHRRNWLTVYDPDHATPPAFQWNPNTGSALYYACYLGLVPAFRYFVKYVDVNVPCGRLGNALTAASFEGHQEIVQLLLDKGAEVNAKGVHFGTALITASSEGHQEIVQLLLEKGAEVNAKGGYFGTALIAASSEGHQEVVQLLLDKGAEVNAKGKLGTALAAASLGGHQEIVQLLLENGAEVNAKGGNYSTALIAASSKGRQEVVQLLLDKGAEVNAKEEYLGNALTAASFEGHQEVVQLLLDKGAEVNAKEGHFSTALIAASLWAGRQEIVQLLLDKGAEVNAKGGHFGTALIAASLGGHQEIVQLLLDKGAEVNAKGGNFGTALAAALSWGGRQEIVQLLRSMGAQDAEQNGK